ncbi:hypothetical protein BHU72_09395 [Desulfuribacillus stibiiarsenatis]|uniref:Carboxyltransferase domain-containing protein n=1 Tax=Desulfuribacillus stibiiarsenatis TaxID=1390249 RepID=A0A1E5L373_9FIRM|nr:hypothetical protein BHU72_09395 [Desulfuribacillus stibiiarsenatis]
MVIENAGLLDSIQDLGRIGYRGQGMTVSGAMDSHAYQIGNLLLGNHRNTPSLEITLTPPVIRFSKSTIISLAGADFQPMINDKKIPMWSTIPVQRDDVLTFGKQGGIGIGCRSYLSVLGGFQVPKVMGSAATYIRAHIGGIEGRRLRAGDQIPYLDYTGDIQCRRTLNHQYLPNVLENVYPNDPVTLRVIEGPQSESFSEHGLSSFYQEVYQVTKDFDRMGIRLQGRNLEHMNDQSKEIISDAVTYGSIQVTPDGQPVILGADCQTTGGYPKIACVATIDLPRVAQLTFHQKIKFMSITVYEAHRLWKTQEKIYRILGLSRKNISHRQ